MKNIIIIGSRGYESNYGGWETFVTNLINNYDDKNTRFYVPELTNKKNTKTEIRNGVICKQIYVPDQGFVTMFTFVIKAVLYYKKLIKKEKMENVVMYILGCRVGPLFSLIHKKLNKMGVKILINPDGLEWKREKWSWWIKECFKISEKTMIKSSDYVVCDSKAIEKYVKQKYKKYDKKTTFIAYGSYIDDIKDINKETNDVMQKYDIKPREYYLFVGRFEPENNIELIIKEFMNTDIDKDLVIVTNFKKNKFYNKLLKNTNFDKDKRIKIIGPIYDQDILRRIRKNAKAYIHGHSAGGTNPSLLEAMSITDVNILYNAVYNMEVGDDAALYFSNQEGSLVNQIEYVEKLKTKTLNEFGEKAKERIRKEYTWDIVVKKYKKLFDKVLKKD